MNIKSFFKKIFIFFLPIFILLIIEICILPIDFFTFRSWESLSVKSLNYFFYGTYYPNIQVSKVETGDLGHHTSFEVPRKVTWFTDSMGARNRKLCVNDGLDLVIGDSFVVGTGLDQSQILTEQLESKTKNCTYSFSPRGLDESMLLYRKAYGKPRTIILVRNEDTLALMIQSTKQLLFDSTSVKNGIGFKIKTNLFVQKILIILDRILNLNSIRFLQAQTKLKNFLGIKSYLEETRNTDTLTFENTNMLFKYGSVPIQYDQNKLKYLTDLFYSIQNNFKNQNINFILVPIPRKETLYPELLRKKFDPHFYSDFLNSLKIRGINVIDLYKPFRKIYDDDKRFIYQTDDTHWNAEGVEITADLIYKKLKATNIK